MIETLATNLRIRRHYALVAHGPDTVEIRHGVWNPVSFVLNDESESGNLYRVLQRLDGTATPAGLARELGVPREEVEGLIDHLDGLGVLESGPSSALDYYLDNVQLGSFGIDVPRAQDTRRIVVMGEPSLADSVGELLRQVEPNATIVAADDRHRRIVCDDDVSWLFDGIRFHEQMQVFETWKDSFVLMASSVINPLHYKVLNRAALEHGFPWMHAAIDGPFLLIGPIFVPHRSACYECFEQRITMNLRDAASYVAYKDALVKRQIKSGTMPIASMLRALIASHSAMEIVNFTRTNYSFVLGKVLAIFLPTMEFTYNEVLRVPGCPACGSLSERDDTELYFDVATLIEG